jgi:hypothetical protein
MKDKIKRGRGVEISYEALLAILRDRFPNFVAWDEFEKHFTIDADPQVQMLRLWSAGLYDHDAIINDRSVNPVRRIGQGAPIPVAQIGTDSVVRDGKQRCGTMLAEGSAFQCQRIRGHTGEHVVEDVSYKT